MKASCSTKAQFTTRSNTVLLPKLSPTPKTPPLLIASRSRIKTQSHFENRTGLNREGILYGAHCQRLIANQALIISDLFKRIEELRRENGLIAIDSQDEAQEEDVPYHPKLRGMNEEICRLKEEIKQRMSGMFKKVRHYPKMKRTVQNLLAQKTDSSTFTSCQLGRVAALKAQRRIIEGNQSKLKKLLQRVGRQS